MALARSYAKFISSLNYNDLPIQVADKLKASILHALVVSIICLLYTSDAADE